VAAERSLKRSEKGEKGKKFEKPRAGKETLSKKAEVEENC